MDYTRFLVRLSDPLPELTALAQDRLLIRVGHLDSLLLIRSLAPNWGCVGEAIARGAVYPIDPVPVEDIMRLVACADGSTPLSQPAPHPPHPPGAWGRRLRLL
jgi:hypothetical protein